ncbi:hypothetical protein BO70DRAFT_293414 [Aspergillus heteromorphus CBS 117.55]|uniref:Tat pathway signal sequence n=1 Tax=Aspergillus heteromorphus CBS 117.55 TaxID=1448321 RepID=A0A317VZS3_9EURO|nr:uncharacterized protein BO70DRAFT_293414 [Aspergillus heteromorphus CBS 117.55]PWY79743.1 hypothetical protein BO70DRAFT_293414 [Aspergillus heteromorphus CBS 117.55]
MASLWKVTRSYWARISSPYLPVRSTEDVDEIDEPLGTESKNSVQPNDSFHLRYFWPSLCFLIGSIAFSTVLSSHSPSDGYCEGKLWAWSPMLGNAKYKWQQLDAEMLPDALYGGPPSDERRNAWDQTMEDGFIGFPRNQMNKINKSIDEDWWWLPPPHENQVIAAPEYYHQLHCVRLLWLHAYRDQWDYTEGGSMSPSRFAVHTKHCYLALKRMLECQADISPVLFEEASSVEGSGVWKPLNAPQKCKDFSAVLEWHADHTVCERPCTYT